MILIGLLACFCTTLVAQPQKHALLMGISQYPTGWPETAGAQDALDLSQLLLSQGFPAPLTTLLTEAQAQRDGIQAALEALYERVRAGDVVVIYFSGHGNTLPDDDGDETEDGLDEAIAPYDAPNGQPSDRYLRDDQIGDWIVAFSRKLGPSGHLLFILDACFSGEANRGISRYAKGGHSAARSGSGPLASDSYPHDLPASDGSSGAAPWVFMAASQAGRVAGHTADGRNSLFTRLLIEVLSGGTPVVNYRQLETMLAAGMAAQNYSQRPWLGGHLDSGVLGGEFKPLPAYCNLLDYKTANSLKIQGWALLQARIGDAVVFYPTETIDTTGIQPALSGIISAIHPPQATVKANGPLPEPARMVGLKALLRGAQHPHLKVAVAQAAQLHLGQIPPHLAPELEWVIALQPAELLLDASADSLLLLSHDHRLLASFALPFVATDSLLRRIRRYASAQAIRTLQYQSVFCDIGAVLRSGPAPDSPAFTDVPSRHQVGARVWLHLSNHTNRRLYFNVLEVFGNDNMGVVFPNPTGNWTPDQCYVEANQTRAIDLILYPAGSSILKILATNGQSFDLSAATQQYNRAGTTPTESWLQALQHQLQPTLSRTDDGYVRRSLDVEALFLWIE